MRTILLISFLSAIVSGSVVTAETMASVWKLFSNYGSITNKIEFWNYFLLQLQDDTTDTLSDCITKFEDIEVLLTTIDTEINTDTDPSTAGSDDYVNGLSSKGNGSPTVFGFWVYKALKYTDVLIEGVDLFDKCHAKDYMLSFGKSVTSVNGAI